MNRIEVLEKVNIIFKDNFNKEDLVITEQTVAADIPAWDSLEHINLITAIEDEFDMQFTMKEVTGMQTVGEMLTIIVERVGG